MSPQWPQVPWEGAAKVPLIPNPFVNWVHSHSPGQRLCGVKRGQKFIHGPPRTPKVPTGQRKGADGLKRLHEARVTTRRLGTRGQHGRRGRPAVRVRVLVLTLSR